MAIARGISRRRFLAADGASAEISRRDDRAAGGFFGTPLHEALPKILAAAPPNERPNIARQFDRVASSAQGSYALVDYVNFKGEGTLATERYQSRGWGLLQVLERMHGSANGAGAAGDFADAASAVLRERVTNAPPQRHEQRWLRGWLNRVASYRKPPVR